MISPGDNKLGVVRFSSLLVSAHQLGLIRLRCPFQVEVIQTLDTPLELGSLHVVHYVQFRPNLPYFKIEEGLFPCVVFAILL